MKITVATKLDTKQDVLALGIFEDDKGHYKTYNKTLHAELNAAVKAKRFSKKFGEMYSTKFGSFEKVVVVGLGKKKEMTLEKMRKVLGKVVKAVKGARLSTCTTNIVKLTAAAVNETDVMVGRACAEGLLLGNYAFVKYLDKEKAAKKKSLSSVCVTWSGVQTSFGKGLKQGRVIAESSNMVRDLVNEPAGTCTSVFMEKAARRVAAMSSKVKVKVLGEPELKRLGMHSMLGVNKGSSFPPKLIFVEYRGAGNGAKWNAFVGKGITFDSGGYNIKPSRYIEDMKTDMAGSAAALGAVRVAALLGVKKNVLGVMGMCENMVDAKAQRPGDIVKAYNGKTIEIGNTDAEGRLVLADALAYTEEKYKPEVMIDMATLTGACVVALGYYAAAVMGKDDKLIKELFDAGMASGDRVWQLPFFDDYQDSMDGTISDLNNINQKGKGYEAGSITAGVFLSKFVSKTRWAHLDIAGSAYWGVKGDYLEKGATGSGVRVLSYWMLK